MTQPQATRHGAAVRSGRRISDPAAIVAKDGAVWRWECRRCHREDTRWTHPDAIRDAREHLTRHQTFGFGGKR